MLYVSNHSHYAFTFQAWVRDCQALSCTNMLETVKATVREYGRKHPDIQPLLETRFNKFVLIEGLSQVRVLYFNLPLIANNIMKDLEKKTSSYKGECFKRLTALLNAFFINIHFAESYNSVCDVSSTAESVFPCSCGS